ncbi:reverse transcriptase domain-containing protein [Tanacetum coccineum]
MKAVKARLNFEETSQYSESEAPSRKRDVRKRLGPKDARNMSRSPEPRRDRSRSPRRKDTERETVFRRLEMGVFHRLGDKEKGMDMSNIARNQLDTYWNWMAAMVSRVLELRVSISWKAKPILAEKKHQEKVQQEKLKVVKARLNFEETSQYSESGAPSRKRDVRKRLGPKEAHSMSKTPEPRRDRSRSPRRKISERRDSVQKMVEKGSKASVIHSSRGDTESYYQSSRSRGTEPTPKRHHDRKAYSRKGGRMLESKDSAGGHWKSKSKKQRSSMEDKDLSQPWVCKETDPFTPRIRYFDLPKRIRMTSHVKTYDGSEDPEDHLKIFQAASKVERWAMPTWCHMFNLTLIENARVWFDDLLPESIDSYDDLKEAFLANYLQQKKCIKDPAEIHHIKQREGESTENFVRRFKIESRIHAWIHENLRIHAWNHKP